MRVKPEAEPNPESNETSRGVLFSILSVVLPLIVLGVCALVLYQLYGPDDPEPDAGGADETAVPPPNPSDPVSGTDPANPGAAPPGPGANLDSDALREQAIAAMRLRYRPGPQVRTLGLQPAADVRGGVMAWMSRRGRTINNPWLVERGRLQRERAPSASPGSRGPTVANHHGENTSQPLTIVPGVPTRIRIDVDHPDGDEAIAGLHVAFGNYTGHFFIPTDGTGADGEVGTIFVTEADVTGVTFGIDSAVLPNGQVIPGPQPYPVTMYIAAEDRSGNISVYATRLLQVVPVGAGDVEVTLTMSHATDLDLYVVEPTGVVVYYRNTNSFTGGHLDLDANAACNSNVGVNNEHIFWNRGQAPAGTYTVRVANYMSCIGGQAVTYQVTVRNCGEVAVFAGSFVGDGRRDQCTSSPGADPTWCHDVVSFAVTPCPQ